MTKEKQPYESLPKVWAWNNDKSEKFVGYHTLTDENKDWEHLVISESGSRIWFDNIEPYKTPKPELQSIEDLDLEVWGYDWNVKASQTIIVEISNPENTYFLYDCLIKKEPEMSDMTDWEIIEALKKEGCALKYKDHGISNDWNDTCNREDFRITYNFGEDWHELKVEVE